MFNQLKLPSLYDLRYLRFIAVASRLAVEALEDLWSTVQDPLESSASFPLCRVPRVLSRWAEYFGVYGSCAITGCFEPQSWVIRP